MLKFRIHILIFVDEDYLFRSLDGLKTTEYPSKQFKVQEFSINLGLPKLPNQVK